MNVYLDASFLVSLYSADSNSATAVGTMQLKDRLPLVTTLAQLEVGNAFELRVFRSEITAPQKETSLRDFAADLRKGIFQLRAIPEGSFLRAERMSRQTTSTLGTRTADLLHVAAAIELRCEWLYSFDERQRRLAQAMKLKLNPLS